MAHNNAQITPSSAKGGNCPSTDIAGEGAQAGPDVPPRPLKRSSVKDRASMIQTATSKRISTANVGPKAPSGLQPTKTSVASSKPSPAARIRELQLANEALEARVKGQEQRLTTLSKRADRAAAADAALSKMKFEKERLTIDLASKTQKAQGLDTRVTEMGSRLVQSEKRAKSLEDKAADLEKRNNDLTVKLQAATRPDSSAPATPTDVPKLTLENAELREKLELANASLQAAETDANYAIELGKVNADVNYRYATVVNELSVRDSLISEVMDEVPWLEKKFDDLKGKIDTKYVRYLQDELKKPRDERDHVEFNALNGFKQFKHLKQKPQQKLNLDIGTGVETTPLAVNSLQPVSRRRTLYSPPSPAGSHTLQTFSTPSIRITVNIGDSNPRDLKFVQRMKAALCPDAFSIKFQGPDHLIDQIQRATEDLEADHAANLAKIVELRANLQGQTRDMDVLRANAEHEIRQLKTRHCVLTEHRHLEDHIKAMQERLDMQAMLLARPEPPVDRRPEHPGQIESHLGLADFVVPGDDGLGA